MLSILRNNWLIYVKFAMKEVFVMPTWNRYSANCVKIDFNKSMNHGHGQCGFIDLDEDDGELSLALFSISYEI